MDAKQQLIETWEINNRINLYLLNAIPDDQLATSFAKGKSVGAQFSHIHSVRLMWLKAAAPDLWEGQRKLEGKEDRSQIQSSLEGSAKAIGELLSRSIDAGGKVKNFKPHVTAFLAYLVSHEGNHRAQAELALRQAGNPISDKVMYGLWEWGTR